MIYVYDIEGNRLAVYDAISEEEAKQIHGENIFISDINYGEKAIVENGELRAITRLDRIKSGEEELREGEYIKDDEIITTEKPDNFHVWDSKVNEWVYVKELEINALEEELGSLELEKYNKNKEIKELKEQGQTFAAKKLEKEVVELEKQFEEKLKRYEELEG